MGEEGNVGLVMVLGMCGSSSLIGMWDPVRGGGGGGMRRLGFWGCVIFVRDPWGGPGSLSLSLFFCSVFLLSHMHI